MPTEDRGREEGMMAVVEGCPAGSPCAWRGMERVCLVGINTRGMGKTRLWDLVTAGHQGD